MRHAVFQVSPCTPWNTWMFRRAVFAASSMAAFYWRCIHLHNQPRARSTEFLASPSQACPLTIFRFSSGSILKSFGRFLKPHSIKCIRSSWTQGSIKTCRKAEVTQDLGPERDRYEAVVREAGHHQRRQTMKKPRMKWNNCPHENSPEDATAQTCPKLSEKRLATSWFLADYGPKQGVFLRHRCR